MNKCLNALKKQNSYSVIKIIQHHPSSLLEKHVHVCIEKERKKI